MKSKLNLLLTLFLSLIIQNALAQEKVVSGVVKDANGKTLPGVNIIIKQTKTSTQRGCQIDYLIQTKINTLFICEFKFKKENN